MHTRHQVKRTIEVVVDRRFQNINALEDHLDHLGQEIRPRAIYEGLCRDFNRYVQEGDYRSVLRVYNQKTMLVQSNVAQCGCQNKDEYIKSIFTILQRDNATPPPSAPPSSSVSRLIRRPYRLPTER